RRERRVAIRDAQQQRRSRRPPAHDAGDDLDAVALELHAAAAAEPLLPPRELGIDGVDVDRESGRDPLEQRDDGGAVPLAPPRELQPHAEAPPSPPPDGAAPPPAARPRRAAVR